MITVITEIGVTIPVDNALQSQGSAAVDAYVAAERKKLGLPDKPLHSEKDKAAIDRLRTKQAKGADTPTPEE